MGKKGREGEGKDIDRGVKTQGEEIEGKVESGREVGRNIKPKAKDYDAPASKNFLQAYLEGLERQVSRRRKEEEAEHEEKEGQNQEEMKAMEEKGGKTEQKNEMRRQMKENGEKEVAKEERRSIVEDIDGKREGSEHGKGEKRRKCSCKGREGRIRTARR